MLLDVNALGVGKKTSGKRGLVSALGPGDMDRAPGKGVPSEHGHGKVLARGDKGWIARKPELCSAYVYVVRGSYESETYALIREPRARGLFGSALYSLSQNS